VNHIPFNRPFIIGKELYYISQAVMSGKLAGDGNFTRRCQQWMEEQFDARRVFLTTSCTTALEMSAMLCDIKPGDEVILPSFTFVTTANAFVRQGARPAFVDIRPDTLNIDETRVEAAVTERTKAIIPVHYAGVGAEMDAILEIAAKYDIPVVEDAAQGVKAAYKGKYLGTLGQLGCYSFHETKNFISGEGSALVVNEEKYIERAEIIREKGTDRSKFFRGEVDKYTWIDVGSSFLPSELIAAFLFAQLEEAETIMEKRQSIFNYYAEKLRPLEKQGYLRLPVIPDHCSHNAHMFYILLQSEKSRNDLMKFLNENGINAVFHYLPLHASPMGRSFGYEEGDLPETENASRCLLRLPCYYELEKNQQDRVVELITKFFPHLN